MNWQHFCIKLSLSDNYVLCIMQVTFLTTEISHWFYLIMVGNNVVNVF
jgi:hypothetical protein